MHAVSRIFAIAAVLALGCPPAHASPKSHGAAPPEMKLEGPKFAEEEYHARLRPLSVPGLRKDASPKYGRHVYLELVVVSEDEDNLGAICLKAPAYRDALLMTFHKTPVVLTRRGGLYDRSALIHRVTEVLQESLGNELVTGIRLASEHVSDYAEKTVTCSR